MTDSLQEEGRILRIIFPFAGPALDLNRAAGWDLSVAYRGWIVKGMERAILKMINWSALSATRQGPQESPSDFLDKL